MSAGRLSAPLEAFEGLAWTEDFLLFEQDEAHPQDLTGCTGKVVLTRLDFNGKRQGVPIEIAMVPITNGFAVQVDELELTADDYDFKLVVTNSDGVAEPVVIGTLRVHP